MKALLAKLKAWLDKPTSKAGMTAIGSAVLGALGGATSWQHAIPLVAFGGAMIAWPDNSVAQKDIEALVSDAVTAAVAVKMPAPAAASPTTTTGTTT